MSEKNTVHISAEAYDQIRRYEQLIGIEGEASTIQMIMSRSASRSAAEKALAG